MTDEIEELLDRARAAIEARSPDAALIAELAAELEILFFRCIDYMRDEREARREVAETIERSQMMIRFLRAHRDALLANLLANQEKDHEHQRRPRSESP